MIRQRNNHDSFKTFRKLDAFTKIPSEYKSTSTVGGTLSILSRVLILYLIYNEVIYYMDSKLLFQFIPDTDMDTKLKIHVDITIASPCRSIGADILDSTQQNVFSFGVLEEEDTWWQLNGEQREHFDYIHHLNGYLRESYHSIFKILYKIERQVLSALPKSKIKPITPYDACRLHGSLTLNKVAGNFHVTGGKSLHFPQGHIHINGLFNEFKHNFSHRIVRFSFGDEIGGIIHPLEGDERIITDSTTMMQYFIEVVPTDVKTLLSNVKTFQYSVKENERPIDHNKGSHGVPGLYFKYDVSALKVIVKQDRENIIQFCVRLTSIIAGVIVISGLLNSLIQCVIKVFFYFMIPKQYQSLNNDSSNLQHNAIIM